MEQTEGVLLMHCVVVMCIVFYYYAACLSKGLYTRTLLGLAFWLQDRAQWRNSSGVIYFKLLNKLSA